MKNIGKKLKRLSLILLIMMLAAILLAAAMKITGCEDLPSLLKRIGLPEENDLPLYVSAGLMILAGVLLIVLIARTVFAFGQAVDCLEDIADAQEETNRCLRTLIERVEHLPVLQLGSREADGGKQPAAPGSFRPKQTVFTTRETAKEKPEEKPDIKTEKKPDAGADAAPEKADEKSEGSGSAPKKAAPSGILPSESWKCPGCGQINPSDRDVCSSCKEKSLWKCGRCGAVNPYSTDVCPECGTRDTRPCPRCGNILPRNRLICDVCHNGQLTGS